jgi:Sec-independent protein secretion pathway component TatC
MGTVLATIRGLPRRIVVVAALVAIAAVVLVVALVATPEDLVSLVELLLYIAAILALSMAVTWAVVKVSPSESAKEQREAEAKGEA